MKKYIISFLLLILLIMGGFFTYKKFFDSKIVSIITENSSGGNSSEVKKVSGAPRIFINGKEKELVLSDWYYYPNSIIPGETGYQKGNWLTSAKQIIDETVANGANTLVLRIWWSDLNTATTRPNDIASSLDFKDLDTAMNYANEKGLYVIPYPSIHKMMPDWWSKENNFPPYISSPEKGLITPCIPAEKGASISCIPKEICGVGDPRCCNKQKEDLVCIVPAVKIVNNKPQIKPTASGMIPVQKDQNQTTVPYNSCKDCETDSYGWKYNYPSMAGEKITKDYSDFLKVVINRYKNNPAVVGWLSAVGPTGEDTDADYVQIRGVYGGIMGEAAFDQIAGYSDFSQDEFKKWINDKYKNDLALQSAWNDKSLSLNNIRIPDSRNLLKDKNSKKVFPDDFSVNYFTKVSDLNQKGKDFYDFKNYMKNNFRNSFISLFKSLDPKHILIYQGTNNDGVYSNPNIDGIYSNNHVEYSLDKNEQSTLIFTFIARAIENNKASLFGIESKGIDSSGLTGSTNNDEQKQALVLVGKVIKCMSGYTGYASGLSTDPTVGPVWSASDLVGLKDISDYSPKENCIYDLIKPEDVMLKDHTLKEFINLFNLQKYYKLNENYVNNESTSSVNHSETSQNISGKCGDGICDAVEKSSGLCKADCSTNSPTTAEQPKTTPTTTTNSKSSCGDGICDAVEKSSGMCPIDCKK